MIKLRPYQIEPVRKAVEFFHKDNPDPALIVQPTGAGKSILAAEVAAACPDPILVVQPTKELLEQNLEKYRLLCGDLAPAGIYSASFGKKEIDHVTFATIGSIKNEGKTFRELGFRKMLIDEAHLYPRKEQSMLGGFLKDSGIRHVLGMTATPLKLQQFSEKQEKRFDKWSELIMLTNPSPDGSFFKDILHVGQIQELTLQRFWSPVIYEVLPFDRTGLQYNSAGSEYTEDSVVTSYVANNIRANIIAALDYHRERRHCLVFVPTVEEAEAISLEYPDSAVVSGTTPKKQRQEIIEQFRDGKIRVIFNCAVLLTGFDFPEIDMIAIGYSTASVAKFYQTVGRGIRIHPDKKDCVVVDAGGNVERFGFVEDIRYEFDGRWRMFGTDGVLLTGIPISAIGAFDMTDVRTSYTLSSRYETISFGKHKGKGYADVPLSYLRWMLTSPPMDPYAAATQKANILRIMENHIRDTTADPPMTTLPDGQHAGEHIGFVPRGYLLWYYNSKEWNNINDSLRRGIEIYINNP